MEILVEFCINNYHHGTEKLKEKLEENPNYEVMEYNCLGYCTRCLLTPFALVEG